MVSIVSASAGAGLIAAHSSALAVAGSLTVVALLIVLLSPAAARPTIVAMLAIAAVILVPGSLYGGPLRQLPMLAFGLALLALTWFKLQVGFAQLLLLGFLLTTSAASGIGLALERAGLVVLATALVLAGSFLNFHALRKLLVGLGTFQVVLAIVQQLTVVPLPWDHLLKTGPNEILGGSALRSTGTLGSPLVLAFFLTIVIALALTWETGNRALRTVIIFSCFLGMVCAGARSSFFIGAILVFTFVGASTSTRRSWIVVPAVAAFAYWLFSSGPLSLGSETAGSLSFTHRQGAVEAMPRVLTDQPVDKVLLGGGWDGMFPLFNNQVLQTDGFQAVDNQFVALLVTSGLIGTVLLVIPALIAIYRGHATFKIPLIGCLLSWFIFDTLLWDSSFLVTLLFTSLALSQTRGSGEPENSPRANYVNTSNQGTFTPLASDGATANLIPSQHGQL